MKICLISVCGEGAWFAWLWKQAGHDVDFVLKYDEYQDILAGLVEPSKSLSPPESYDLICVDSTGEGRLADQVREKSPTIGGSVLADRLEFDRLFGLEYMEKCSIHVPRWYAFDNPADAIRLIRKTKARYVYKACGNIVNCATSYVAKSAEDLEGYIGHLFAQTKSGQFILQEFVQGTECSTECWINQTGYYAINHTLEEKKQLSGNLGPNVGCAGNVVWMPERETTLFREGLKKATRQLAADGYVGNIDLNTIVTQDTVYGLEWTPRLGYDATPCLTQLLPMEFGEFLYQVAAQQKIPPLVPKHAFSASTRLYIPPYPADGSKRLFKADVPIDGLTEKMLPGCFIYDVKVNPDSEKFVSAGVSGWIACPMGTGETISGAFEEVKQKISLLRIPDLSYRNDVPESVARRYRELESGGWLRAQFGQ